MTGKPSIKFIFQDVGVEVGIDAIYDVTERCFVTTVEGYRDAEWAAVLAIIAHGTKDPEALGLIMKVCAEWQQRPESVETAPTSNREMH